MLKRLTVLPVLAAVAIALSACEDSVDAVLQTELPFTLYGYFNPLADTQAVRLFTIDGILEQTRPEPIDATVSANELETGIEFAFRDSIVQFASGTWGHVFWSEFRPSHERTYRIEARRSDGLVSAGQSTVPPMASPEVGETDLSDFLLPVPILWRNAPNLIDIVAVYYTTGGAAVVEYGVEQEDHPDGRRIELQLRRDTRDVLFNAIQLGFDEVFLDSIEVRVVVTSADWSPPDGAFDPNVLVEPGIFSNVENGFGFIGAGYPLELVFMPTDAVRRAAGFDVE